MVGGARERSRDLADSRREAATLPRAAQSRDLATGGLRSGGGASRLPTRRPPLWPPAPRETWAGERHLPSGPASRAPGGPASAEREEADAAASSDDEQPPRRHLAGWVFDRGGDAVPNLAVFAIARRLFGSSPGIGNAGRLSARTGSDGSFVFSHLVDGEYLVTSAETGRYEAASTTVRAGVDSAVITVDEKAGRALRVYGAVASNRSSPLKGVRVEPIGQTERTTYTDEIGRYTLTLSSRSTGTLSIRFLKQGFRETRLNVALDTPEEELTLNATLAHLERMARVTGSVAANDGSPVHLAGVQLYSAVLRRTYRASSDRAGGFVFPEVEVGEGYRLWVHPPTRYRDQVLDDLVIPTEGLDLPVTLDALGEAQLTGQMVDPDGRPVPGLSLWLITASAGKGPLQVTGDGGGRFFAGPLPEGEVVLQTRSVPLLSVSGIALSAGASRQVRLVLDVGSLSVGGHVVDAQGIAVAGARVSLFWRNDENGLRSLSRRETPSDAAGYFLLTQLGSGAHSLSVSAPGFRSVTLTHRVGVDEPAVVVRMDKAAP